MLKLIVFKFLVAGPFDCILVDDTFWHQFLLDFDREIH